MAGSLQLHDHDSGAWQPVCNYIAAFQVCDNYLQPSLPISNKQDQQRSWQEVPNGDCVILQLTTMWDSLNVNNWNNQNGWNQCGCMTYFMTALLNADYQVPITVVN